MMGSDIKKITDEEVGKSLEEMEKEGTPASFFKLVDAICGPDFRDMSDNFGAWVRDTEDPERIEKSEQTGSSLPQPGAGALNAGGEGTIQIINYFLGHPIPKHYIVDHLHHTTRIIETGIEDQAGTDEDGIFFAAV